MSFKDYVGIVHYVSVWVTLWVTLVYDAQDIFLLGTTKCLSLRLKERHFVVPMRQMSSTNVQLMLTMWIGWCRCRLNVLPVSSTSTDWQLRRRPPPADDS